MNVGELVLKLWGRNAAEGCAAMPELALVKPGLREDILTALRSADTLRYPSSMRPLVEQDIRQAITDIERRTQL